MNIDNYKMGYDGRKNYVITTLKEYLTADDDAFVEAVNELIRYNGFIDTEAFPMDMIDEICGDMKPSELINKMTSDFDSNDNYFYFSIYGLESCNDIADLYRDETTVNEVVDELVDGCGYSISFNDCILSELMDVINDDDFGIEDGWEYDEEDEDAEEPEETDYEFMTRINDIY